MRRPVRRPHLQLARVPVLLRPHRRSSISTRRATTVHHHQRPEHLQRRVQRPAHHCAVHPDPTARHDHPGAHDASPSACWNAHVRAASRRAVCGCRGGSTPRTDLHFEPASAPQNGHPTACGPDSANSRTATSRSRRASSRSPVSRRTAFPAPPSCAAKCTTPTRSKCVSAGVRTCRSVRSTSTRSCSLDGSGSTPPSGFRWSLTPHHRIGCRCPASASTVPTGARLRPGLPRPEVCTDGCGP